MVPRRNCGKHFIPSTEAISLKLNDEIHENLNVSAVDRFAILVCTLVFVIKMNERQKREEERQRERESRRSQECLCDATTGTTQ